VAPRREWEPAVPAAARAATPPGIDPHLVSLLDPRALEAEPYRALRHLVELRRQVTGARVLVVTSPGAGDGKTTTAINLAGALAQDPGARVLLIDADLRDPAVALRLGLEGTGRPGLAEAILDRGRALETAVEPVPAFNLHLLRAGRPRGGPYELLASPRLAELLAEARERFDHVLVDSPPLVPFPDGRVLAGHADGCLLVVCASRTPRRLVEEALALLDPGKLAGLVFNGEERSLAQYHQYSYRQRGPAPPPPPEPVAGNGQPLRGWLPALRARAWGRRAAGASRDTRS
jgi:capsular exopolysaccharide synthesis family protein